MSISISNMAELTMSISDAATSVSDAIGSLDTFLMESATSIGDAMTACCMAQYGTGAAVAVPTHNYIPGVPAMPGPPAVPAVPPMLEQGFTDPIPAMTPQQASVANQMTLCNLQNYQSDLQNTQWQSWFADYQSWRDLQIVPQIIALGAALVNFQSYQSKFDAYLNCANDILADHVKPTIKALADCHEADKSQLKDKVGAMVAEQDTVIQQWVDAAEKSQDNVWCDEIRDLFFEDGGGPGELGAGYATLQRSHAQNIATHLAQICTDGRDASLALKDWWQTYDQTQIVDKYQDLECALVDTTDDDSMASQLLAMLGKAQDICATIQMCGQNLQNDYTTKLQGPQLDYLQDIINCVDGDGAGNVLTQMKDNHQVLLDCLENQKLEYTNTYQGLMEPGCNVDLAIDSVKQIFDSPDGITSVRDCIDYFKTLADSRDEIIERYLGVNTANGSSGEFCLGRVIIDQACGLVKNSDGAVQALDALGEDCLQFYMDDYRTGESCFATALFDYACQLSTCLVTLNDWFKNNRDDMLQCYEDGYAGEKDAMASLIADATTLTDKHSETYQWLCDCAIELKEQLYATCYQPGESQLVKEALQQAFEYLAKQNADYQFARDNADLTFACWNDDYKAQQKCLDDALMVEAKELVGCLSDAHEFLCDKADKQYAHWCDFWKEKEETYVCEMFDCATQLLKESYECFDDMCNIADNHLEWWRDCYEQAECVTAPKLINAAARACEKNESTYEEICRHEEDMYAKWQDVFCTCDIKDLRAVCDIYNKVDPTCEIHTDAECAQALAETLKDCYYDLVLPCEKNYIDEICKMEKYEPRYCEVESRALLAIRATFARREKELRCRANKFNKGLIEKQIMDMHRDLLKAEAASVESANRWEKWWEVAECDRRHRYRMDVIQVGERYPTNAMAAYQQSTQGYDIILQRLQQRIERGYVYLSNSQQYADRVLNSTAQAVNSGIATIREGHFWPEHYLNIKNSYQQHVNARLDDTAEVMRIGTTHMQQAESSKAQAAQIATAAIDRGQQAISNGLQLVDDSMGFQNNASQIHQAAINTGLQTVDRGHQVLRQAIEAKVQADQVASRSMSELLGAIDRGHFWQTQATNNADLSGQLISRTMDDGLFLTDKGHNLKSMAIQAETQQAAQATDFVQTGLQSIDRGHFWVQQQSNDKQNAASQWHQGFSENMELVQNARAHIEQAVRQAQVADGMLQGALGQGLAAGDQALNAFRAANDKLSTALQASMEAMGLAQNMSNAGADRQSRFLEALSRHMQMVPNVANSFNGIAQTGNRLMELGTSHEKQLARCSLDRMNAYCDAIQRYHSHLTRGIGNIGGNTLGQAFNAAMQFQSLSQNSLNDIIGVTTSIFASPPNPFQGVNTSFDFGAGNSVSGSASGGSGTNYGGSWYPGV